VFHDGIQTQIKETVLRSERFAVCQDLGVRASDLLQSNAIIWVEGPSDRIYVRHWINAMDATLVEGIHFSIMFYGGRLLSHLTADDPVVDEFISLRALNRNLAIVMDSDKSSSRDTINDTKNRLDSELSAAPGISWITYGREIENYLDFDLLQQALKDVHKGTFGGPTSTAGRYKAVLPFVKAGTKGRGKGSVERYPDKVAVAKHVCRHPPNLDIYDLRERVASLVAMIRAANS
jgi:hypothetical protein